MNRRSLPAQQWEGSGQKKILIKEVSVERDFARPVAFFFPPKNGIKLAQIKKGK